MLAASGDYDEAINLIRQIRRTERREQQAYQEATIAFLQRNRPALLAARDELLAIPEPDDFRQAAARYRQDFPAYPPLVWPLNLEVVEGLIACFHQPYLAAYECSGPSTY